MAPLESNAWGVPCSGRGEGPKPESRAVQTQASWVTRELSAAPCVGKDTPGPQNGDTQPKLFPLKIILTLNIAQKKIWCLLLGTQLSITMDILGSSETFQSETISL